MWKTRHLSLIPLLAILLGMVVGGSSMATSNTMPPKSDRLTVDAAKAPWNAIGRLNQSGKGHCTGVLISSNQVLTAAHCVWNRATAKPYAAKDLHFLAGYQKGSYEAHRRGRSITMAKDYQPNRKSDLERASADWAILELDRPISGIKPLPLQALSSKSIRELQASGAQVRQAGYSRGWRYVQTVDDQCDILGQISKRSLLAHTCKAVPGDSGSPLLITLGGETRVVAIHVATVRGSRNALGVAVSGTDIDI